MLISYIIPNRAIAIGVCVCVCVCVCVWRVHVSATYMYMHMYIIHCTLLSAKHIHKLIQIDVGHQLQCRYAHKSSDTL